MKSRLCKGAVPYRTGHSGTAATAFHTGCEEKTAGALRGPWFRDLVARDARQKMLRWRNASRTQWCVGKELEKMGGGGVFSKLRVQIPVRCGPGFLARTVDSLRRWESKAEYHVNSGKRLMSCDRCLLLCVVVLGD